MVGKPNESMVVNETMTYTFYHARIYCAVERDEASNPGHLLQEEEMTLDGNA